MAGKHAPFSLRILIPFWVLRLILLVINAGVFAFLVSVLAISRQNNNDSRVKELEDQSGHSVGTLLLASSIGLAIAIVTLMLEIIVIIKLARRSLTPRFFLIANCIQTVIWTVAVVQSIISSRGATNLVVSVLVELLFLGLLVYSIVIFRRDRKARRTQKFEGHNLMPQAQGYGPHAASSQENGSYGFAKPQQSGYMA